MTTTTPMLRFKDSLTVGALCAGIYTWLDTRMEGYTLLATTIYLALAGAYLLIKWKFGPWSDSISEKRLDTTQSRALTAAHFAILGLVVAVLGFLIIANEMSRWAPEFTERQISLEKSAWESGEKVLRANTGSTERVEQQMAVVGIAKRAGDVYLVGLKPFLQDTSAAILKKITDVALTLFMLPMIGIPALKLLEAFGGGINQHS